MEGKLAAYRRLLAGLYLYEVWPWLELNPLVPLCDGLGLIGAELGINVPVHASVEPVKSQDLLPRQNKTHQVTLIPAMPDLGKYL